MVRITGGIAAFVAVVALLAALPSSSVAHRGDRDCKDFPTQRRAQFFFLRHGGPRHDPDRLDADHDGIACESNPCPCYRKRHLPRRLERVWRRESSNPPATASVKHCGYFRMPGLLTKVRV